MATQKVNDKKLADAYLAKLEITKRANEVNPFETKAEQDDIFTSMRQFDEDLFVKTIPFQTYYVRKRTQELG